MLAAASHGPLLEIRGGEPADKVDFLTWGRHTRRSGPSSRRRAPADGNPVLVAPFKALVPTQRLGRCPLSRTSRKSTPIDRIHRARASAPYERSLGSIRLTFETAHARRASFAPYDFIEIMTNTRTYGEADLRALLDGRRRRFWSPYVVVHESAITSRGSPTRLQGDVAYEPARRVEPWKPNATALLDPKNSMKDLVSPGHADTDAWNKRRSKPFARIQKCGERSAREPPRGDGRALRRQKRKRKMLGARNLCGKVGAFEGALYEARLLPAPATASVLAQRRSVLAVCGARSDGDKPLLFVRAPSRMSFSRGVALSGGRRDTSDGCAAKARVASTASPSGETFRCRRSFSSRSRTSQPPCVSRPVGKRNLRSDRSRPGDRRRARRTPHKELLGLNGSSLSTTTWPHRRDRASSRS